MAALVNQEYAPGTLEDIKLLTTHPIFLEWKYKVADADIDKLNHEFIAEYTFWLESVVSMTTIRL